MNDFFPSADYKVPETSNYMKFPSPGEYTFRVLSSAIVGFEYFRADNKVTRSKEPFDEVINIKDGGRINHFWAFAVWNYTANKVQILEITQKTIMNQMQALIKNPKWGNPKNYDISITRVGTSMSDTEYSVMPNPHSPIEDGIAEAFMKTNINLEALYDGEDPFSYSKPEPKNSDGSSIPNFDVM